MLSLSSLPHNCFKRRRQDNFPNSQESVKLSTHWGYSKPSIFPLQSRSKDHLSFFQEGQERQVYLQLLQVAATSPEAEFENADVVTPEIVNTLDRSQGASPLHYACMHGNIPIANFLLEKGADVNTWDAGKKVTPLICAAAHGHLDAVKLLLDHGCNIDDGLNGGNEGQHSALLWAVRKNHSKVVEFLLEKGASQSSMDPFSETPIHAAVICDSPQILQILLKHLNQDIKGISNLHMGPEKNSPLHLAVSENCINSFELCKILLEEGNADSNTLDANRRTPLHGAVHNMQVVNLLLAHGAMINAMDIEEKTPLFYAIIEEDKAMNSITALVTAGDCNVNHQDNHGNTPLHVAGLLKDTSIVEILLMHGSDFSIKSDDCVSALSILQKNIPTTHLLLKKVFDQAATLIDQQGLGREKDCKVNVDFSLVLPSSSSKNDNQVGEELKMEERTSTLSYFKRIARKESSKINCLIDEGFSRLLVHPVIRSFLELKWQKARIFYLPKLAFKLLLVLLFTWYVVKLYFFLERNARVKMRFLKLNITNQVVFEFLCDLDDDAHILNESLYNAMLVMAWINALMELVEVLRAPKQQLRCMDPWLSVLVCYLMYKSRPPECDEDKKITVYDPSPLALSILMSWVDVWVDMGRFPKVGLSIRVFLKVLKQFLIFMLPHSSLLFGFMVALTLLFNSDKKVKGSKLTKLIRVMAGDVTKDNTGVIRDYIFTAYVLVVAVVLMNLLNGLAVNNMREIYEDATTEVLLRQTVLVSTLETSLDGKWTRICFPNRFFAKYINLFSSQDSSNKNLTFNAHDSTDSKLSSEHRQALFSIASDNRVANFNIKRRRSCIPYSAGKMLTQESNNDALQKLTDELQDLKEGINNINALLSTSLQSKTTNH